MRLAYTMTNGQRELDPLLEAVADDLIGRGLRVVGMVQINEDRTDGARCDMLARVLPDGPSIRISQSLGPNARGCRLDPDGLETAAGETQARLQRGADILIINKFGKQEAAGRGLRPLIAQALDAQTDVLVGVNPLNLPALEAFSGGLAQNLSPELDDIREWALAAHGGDLKT